MILHTRIRWIMFLLVWPLMLSCERDSDSRTEPRGPVALTHPPVPFSAIRTATPLGNLNPPGHTFPTRHIYFYLQGEAPVPVFAVAPGRIRNVHFNEGSDDYRIEFQHTATYVTYLDHVADIPPAVVEGARVEAGDLVGYGRPGAGAIDLGVFDYEQTGFFLAPERYLEYDIHCVDPYAAFVPDVREALLAFNRRSVEPRGGRIHYDVEGTLAGNWFHESLPVAQSSGWTHGHGHLAFVYDLFDPSVVMISCGGTLATAPFKHSVLCNWPDPGSVTQAEGTVKVALNARVPTVMLVALLDRGTLRAEVFVNRTPDEVDDFTEAAHTYIR